MVGDKIIASDAYQLWSGVIKPSGFLKSPRHYCKFYYTFSFYFNQAINDDDEHCFQTPEMSLCYKIIIQHLDIFWQT